MAFILFEFYDVICSIFGAGVKVQVTAPKNSSVKVNPQVTKEGRGLTQTPFRFLLITFCAKNKKNCF